MHFALHAVALSVLLQGIQIPAPTGLVNDFAGVLSPESRSEMTRVIEAVRARTGGEMTVVTLADIRDYPIEDIALRIGREWKVGKAADPGDPARSTGLVMLIVPKETNSSGRGHCRIETGTGTEGFVTDGIAGSLCREVIPFFQQRDYSAGAKFMVQRLAQLYAAEFGFTDSLVPPASATRAPPENRQQRRGSGFGFLPLLIMFALIFMFLRSASGYTRGTRGRRGRRIDPLLLAILTNVLSSGGGRRRRSSGWGGGWSGGGGGWGGGGGGGFGGFGGGGGFSGGGGGSSW